MTKKHIPPPTSPTTPTHDKPRPSTTASQSPIPPPQAFEIAIAQQIESRSSSLLSTFLRFDAAGDGHISRSEFKNALHNVLGIDLTGSQMNDIFVRFAFFSHDRRHHDADRKEEGGRPPPQDRAVTVEKKDDTVCDGIRYVDFVKYIAATAYALPSSSAYGSTLSLHAQTSGRMTISDPPEGTVAKELKSVLKRKLIARGISETELFLSMDEDRSGRVTPGQFQAWAGDVGLKLSMEQCHLILGDVYYREDGINLPEFKQMMEHLDDDGDGGITNYPWEHQPSKHEIWKEKNDKEEAEQAAKGILPIVIEACVDDAKTDQVILKSIAESLFQKHVKLVEAFQNWDLDGTRRLNVEEFREALKTKVGLDLSVERVVSLVGKFDQNGDGKLSTANFVSMISGQHLAVANEKHDQSVDSVAPSVSDSTSALEAKRSTSLDENDINAILSFRKALEEDVMKNRPMFEKLDTDNSQYLSAHQLLHGFEELKVDVSKIHIDHIMNRFADGTDRLKYFQFVKFLSEKLH